MSNHPPNPSAIPNSHSAPFTVRIPCDSLQLEGELCIPPEAKGIVVFVHGSGSSRFSPRNRFVAEGLRSQGHATLLLDLLSESEEAEDQLNARYRFDVHRLSERLIEVTRWIRSHPRALGLGIGLFGASTGAAAALLAAAQLGSEIDAVVSRGGRPDLAAGHLAQVKAPTLLIIGSLDEACLGYNQMAFASLRCPKSMQLVPGATHLFEEPGTLDAVLNLAADWFANHLQQHPKTLAEHRP